MDSPRKSRPTWEFLFVGMGVYLQIAFLVAWGMASSLTYSGRLGRDDAFVVPVTFLVLLVMGPVAGLFSACGSVFALSRVRKSSALPFVLFLCFPSMALAAVLTYVLLLVAGVV